MLEFKIEKAICEQLKPLYEIWEKQAGWSKEESIVMYHKLFDPEKPNEKLILDILADKLENKSYEYYYERKIHRIYKKARQKLIKILP